MISDNISAPICHLCNVMFRKNMFPKAFEKKQDKTTIQKRDKLECLKYRPMCLISCQAKIVETVLKTRLWTFPQQNGFRKAKSTQDDISRLTSNIYSPLDKGFSVYLCGFG